MAAPKIKICGITTAETLEATIAARADYVGFNFYPASPRYLAPREAAALGKQAAGRIIKVGLFVDSADDAIAEAVAAARIEVLQLHGLETPDRAAQLRTRFAVPVWKVIPVASADDIRRAAAYREVADLILFDAKTPKGTMPGGMGLSFDWTLLSADKGTLPWGLAGGLTPVNVAAAITATGAPLVDTASGVETATGVKGSDLITAFCSAVRRT